uniref:carboxylate--amine ligase n=1 Tax=Gemmiger formicilis TaxID=745368 RepID=UPI003FF07158
MPRMLPVLLGGDANVYGMARSFYECYGVRSLAVCRRALPALAHSRLVRVAVQDPAFGQDHVFTATLLGLAAQYPGVPKILISCADDYTALLARHADALRGAYRFACPPPAALHLADKRQFAAACRAAGLRTPQTVTLCTADALPPLPFGWPVIAKPADQAAYARCDFPGRRKVYLVQDAARLRELLAAAARGGYFGSWLVQEYIPGPDTRLGVVNAYCAADGSVPWLVQGQPLLQERTPEGTGNYAAVLVEPSRQDAALLDALRGLLQAADWHGFANFELKYDRRGEPVLFELNPRQGRASYFCDAADAPLAVPPVQDLLYGGPVTPPTLRPAVWYTAPWYAVRRACPNRLALRRADTLRRRGRGRAHLLAAGEGASRRIWFMARQLSYYRKRPGSSRTPTPTP